MCVEIPIRMLTVVVDKLGDRSQFRIARSIGAIGAYIIKDQIKCYPRPN